MRRPEAPAWGAIVQHLQARGVGRLVVESRGDDRDDAATILRARTRRSSLVFEHRNAALELALGLADAVVWSVGAGGQWHDLVEPLLDQVNEVEP